MLKKRIIPILLLRNGALVKTINFKNFNYIGDPVNTVRIFNEMEVDEIILLDIMASKSSSKPNYKLIEKISNECFMPLVYGGGISNLNQIKDILHIGIEKIVLNTNAIKKPYLIEDSAKTFGSQCILGSIDYKINTFSKKRIVYGLSGTQKTNLNPIQWATTLENLGVGELLVTSIDHEGKWIGYDEDLLKKISNQVSLPIIANGGASSISDINSILNNTSCSAAAAASLFVYQKKDMGVLINFPDKNELDYFI